jgi:hypothetical protein
LDGTTGYVQIANTDFSVSNSVSVVAWVKTSDSSNSNREIITRGQTVSPYRGFILKYYDGKAAFVTRSSNQLDTYTEATFNLADNQWHNLVGTYDGTTQKFYIDGNLVSTTSQTGSITESNSPLTIGYDTPIWLGTYFAGSIDEVKIYNKALTAEEVNAQFLNP